MSIPKWDEIRPPALKLLTKHDSLKISEFEEPLAQEFDLTEEEIAHKYESGNGKVFYDRISWALSYLNMSGLVEKPKRGVYQISEQGREILKTPEKLDSHIKEKIKEHEKQKKMILNWACRSNKLLKSRKWTPTSGIRWKTKFDNVGQASCLSTHAKNKALAQTGKMPVLRYFPASWPQAAAMSSPRE